MNSQDEAKSESSANLQAFHEISSNHNVLDVDLVAPGVGLEPTVEPERLGLRVYDFLVSRMK